MPNATGPKSESGKAVSSKNAIKHGLTSTNMLSEAEDTKYIELITELTTEHEPQGTTEKLLIEDLAKIRIRLSRFDAAENALFYLEQKSASSTGSLLKFAGIQSEDMKQQFATKLENGSDFTEEFNGQEKRWCEQILNKIDPHIPIDESIQNDIIEKMYSECYELDLDPSELSIYYQNQTKISSFYRGLDHYDIPDSQEDVIDREKYTRDELQRLTLSSLIDFVKSKLQAIHSLSEKQNLLENIRSEVQLIREASLPEQAELDRIYRYKTSLEKQFSSKLSQLIQLQEIKARKQRLKPISSATSE